MKTRTIETRTLEECQIRSEDGEKAVITGYASVFDSPTKIMNFTEVIKPGAFKRNLAEGKDILALVNHDPSKLVARTSAGTLTLNEDSKGLKVEIMPTDTTVGRDLLANVRSGNISKMSFGFYVVNEDIVQGSDGKITRSVTDIELSEVSAVTFPAYADTELQVRSETLEQIDRLNALADEVPEIDPIDVDNDTDLDKKPQERSYEDFNRQLRIRQLKSNM